MKLLEKKRKKTIKMPPSVFFRTFINHKILVKKLKIIKG